MIKELHEVEEEESIIKRIFTRGENMGTYKI